MAQAKSFVVSQFTKPSKEVVFRVSGWLDDSRIRKNFPSRAEADAERQSLEIQRLQADSGVRPALTRIIEEQIHAAEATFRRLKAAPRSLTFYLDYALTNFRAPEHEKPVADAVKEYFAAKKLENERTVLSLRQLRSIENELGIFLRHFPKGTVSQFTPARLLTYLERGKPGLKTYNNRRGLISTLFKFAFQKDWIVTNPVEKTPHHRINHRRGSAVTITATQARDLMAYLETFEKGALVPHFALCLFAGIRPCIRFGEISRLGTESVRLATGTINGKRRPPNLSRCRHLAGGHAITSACSKLSAIPNASKHGYTRDSGISTLARADLLTSPVPLAGSTTAIRFTTLRRDVAPCEAVIINVELGNFQEYAFSPCEISRSE